MALVKWIGYFKDEVKFIKSFSDIKIFYDQKLPFLINRLTGNTARYTEAPTALQLEPSNYCNIDCTCCPVDRMERKKGNMDFGLFKKIINEASEIGVKRIHLYLHGESMIHPKIVEMIAYIKLNGLGITMHTNGMLLSREKIEKVLQSGINSGDYFIFSILGFSKKVHEKLMKGVNHEKVKKNLSEFIELRKMSNVNGPIIEVLLYRMPENIHEEAEFVRYWSRIVDHVHPVGEISDSFAEYKRDGQNIPSRKKTCKLLWERMTIYWNGDVTMCAEDLDGDYVLGNLKEMSIKEIWNGHKLKSIKRSHTEGNFMNISLCSKCDQ